MGAAVLAIAMVGAACNNDPAPDTGLAAQDNSVGASTANITIAPKGAPKQGGSLTYGVEAETDSMNPTKGRFAISGLMYANAVFDPVAAYDKDGIPQPYLAEKITPSPDYRVWTITFRPGITFHNGQSLDAEAGNLFIEKLRESPLTGPAARPIKKVTKTGPLSADLEMTVPWVAFPHILTGQGGMVPAPAQLNDPGEAGARHPIGTGPFMFKEWTPDNHFTVVRNPNYWRKDAAGNSLPYLDQVEFRPIPDSQSRINSLSAGQLNMLHDSHAQSVEVLEQQAKDGKLQFVLGGGEDEESFVMFNTKAPPLDDVRVRQALAYATDLDQYFGVTNDDPALVADGPFNTDGQWYPEGGTGYPKYDQAKAKELIAAWEKDHPGQKITFGLGTTGNDPFNLQVVQFLKQQWEQVGIDVQINTLDQVTFILGAVTGKYQANLWRQFSAPDPDTDYHFWIGENARTDDQFRLNFANNTDAELDKALNDGRSNPDPAARKAAYAAVAKRMGQQVPYLWLQHVRWSIAADTNVRGILNGPLPDGKESLGILAGVHRLTFTWIEK